MKTQTLEWPKNSLPRPSWLERSVWPYQTYALDTGDTVVAVTEVGDGPPLLFVHTGMWSIIWRDVMAKLSSDFRCVCVDAPSTGLSAGLPRERTTLHESSRAIGAVIEKLDLHDVTLVVHDLGGPAGLAAVARMPERVHGLVAINTFGWKPATSGLRTMLAVMGSPLMREFDVLTGFVPNLTATAFGVGRHFDSASRRAFKRGIGARGTRAFHDYMHSADNSDEVYELAESALSGPLAHLPLLTIFGGRNDPFQFQLRWKQLFPDAVQVVIPNGNHFPMCDDAGLVAQSIRRWWKP